MKQTIKKDEVNLKHKFGMLDFFFFYEIKIKIEICFRSKNKRKRMLRFCRQTNYNSRRRKSEQTLTVVYPGLSHAGSSVD